MITASNITEYVKEISLIKSCDIVRKGVVRVATPFSYPDGSKIDLFIEENLHGLKLSDMGQTVANLLDLHVKPWSSKKRIQAVTDICRSLDVELEGSELFTHVDSLDPNAISMAMVRLAQACIRVSDLALTQRFRLQSAYKDDIEEFVASIELPFDSMCKLPGPNGSEIEVDFQVQGKSVTSLILTLSTQNANAAHPLCNEIFRKWYDLKKLHQSEFQFVTAYDSNTNIFKAEDLQRIEDYSTLIAFPAQSDVMQSVIAA